MHLWWVLAWIAAIIAILFGLIAAANPWPRPGEPPGRPWSSWALPLSVTFIAVTAMCYLVPLAFKIHSA